MLVVDVKPGTFEVLCAWPEGEAWFPFACLNVIRSFHIIDDIGWRP